MNTITLPRLFDAHCHFRLGSMLDNVLPYTARCCEFGLAMPNTKDDTKRHKGAILDAEDLTSYRTLIENRVTRLSPKPLFTPVMTIAIRDNTTPKMVSEAFQAGAKAGKIYPLAVTTNSEEGLKDFFSPGILETFEEMERLGMLALFHGEIAGDRILVTAREQAFLSIFEKLAKRFTKLKMVLEHVSTKAGIELVTRLGDHVAATITAHHLILTLNDVIGDGIRPHNMCMPVPKDFHDRQALVESAISGNPKFFLGSDTAPHMKEKKECSCGACGVYTAPLLPEILTETFESLGKLDRLADFTSGFACQHYGLKHSGATITMEKSKWLVPAIIDGVVPFMAGKELSWKMTAAH